MKVLLIIAALAILAGAAVYILLPRRQIKELIAIMSERVELKTPDQVSIIGDYYASAPPAGGSSKGLLLLHMMPATRQSWRQFGEKMQSAGWHVLAIDLRGHGESQGGPDGYRSFSDAEHQASKLDLEAGVEFLKSKGAAEIYLGGASIGANLALQYLAEHPEAKAAFLLSPGLDYRGLKTEELARGLKPGQSVYYISSSQDANSAQSTKKLFDQTPTSISKEIKIFDNAGHGTTIFDKDPQFMDEIASWLKGR